MPVTVVQPEPTPRLVSGPARCTVVVPDDLVQLVGEERLRKFHAQLAQLLKTVRSGSNVQWKLRTLAGGEVTHSSVSVEVVLG